MLRHRTKKQIIIACIFCGFWGGVIGLIVWLTRPPAVPPTPPARAFQPLAVVSATVLPTVPRHADLVGVIENPNADAGAAEVRYAFVLHAGGAELRRVAGATYLLPGRQKTVVAFNEEVPGDASVDLRLEQPSWTAVGTDYAPPSFVLVNKASRVIPGETYEVKGLLANQSDVDYFRVEVLTVGLDAAERVVGVGHTFLGSLRSLERREFTAQWPLPRGVEVATVRVFPDVNIFLPDAVQERPGALELEDVPRGPLVSPTP